MGRKRERVMTDAERELLGSLRNLSAEWTATRVIRLSTDDKEVAQTYADMLEKRRELHPQALTPPTLGELFGLASAYLARSGRQPTLGQTRLSVGTDAVGTHFGAVGSPLFLNAVAKRENEQPAAGDILLLVRAEDAEILSAAFGRSAVRAAVKQTLQSENTAFCRLCSRVSAGFSLRSNAWTASKRPHRSGGCLSR